MSKKCPSGHDNPDSARFCRICGRPFIDDNSDLSHRFKGYATYALSVCKNSLNKLCEGLKRWINSFKVNNNTTSTEFNITTPEFFRTINLTPISVSKIRFINSFYFIILIVCSALLYLEFKNNLIYEIICPYFRICYLYEPVLYGILGLWGVLVIWLVYTVMRKCIFKINVSYIENGNFIDRHVRVARNKKLGLFDIKKKIVRLWTRYDKIEKFDAEHLLVGCKGKIGIYSLKSRSIIIPIRYTHIEPFSNSMTKATDGPIVNLYDIKGNRLK